MDFEKRRIASLLSDLEKFAEKEDDMKIDLLRIYEDESTKSISEILTIFRKLFSHLHQLDKEIRKLTGIPFPQLL